MLHALQVNRVFGHGHLRSVEHGRLVHVVPGEQVQRAAQVLVQAELLGPPVAHGGRGEVQIGAAAGPAPAVKGGAVLGLHVQTLAVCLLVNVVAVVPLDVRVHNGHHLSAVPAHVALHLLGVGEQSLVPREVSLPVRVLDVQPDHVHWEVQLLEHGLHRSHVPLVAVVPAALVVAQCEQRRQLLRARQSPVLPVDGASVGSGQQEQVHLSGL
mmetsp:Transcript_12900/g.28659  ORF Transcript_12900/g.28659 Transcript_12900/m.28659 type:complete len:212 (+) Transcript_12900:1426-2061(+)